MSATLIFSNTVSPYNELLSYEYLYSQENVTRNVLVELFSKQRDSLPSEVLNDYSGLFGAEESLMSEIESFLDKKLTFSILVEGTPHFPEKLKDASNSLPVFYYKGYIDLIGTPSISIVGARKASPEGKECARMLTKRLVDEGFTIVTGLAAGIDTAAMVKCIEMGGNAIGVIGTPIDQYYPKENRELQDTVASKGLLISQVPLYRYEHQPFETRKYYFLERNITMAALSDATVIIEAGEASGTRTQAKACVEQKRKLIIYDSVLKSVKWAEQYLEKGAFRANTVEDVIQALRA